MERGIGWYVCSNGSLIIDDLGINQGMIFENMVAQMLRANGHELYFHEFEYCPEGNSVSKTYEIDFLTVRGKRLAPIEVKSSGYKSHKSFDYFKDKYQVKMNDGGADKILDTLTPR